MVPCGDEGKAPGHNSGDSSSGAVWRTECSDREERRAPTQRPALSPPEAGANPPALGQGHWRLGSPWGMAPPAPRGGAGHNEGIEETLSGREWGLSRY